MAHGWLLFEESKMSKSRGNIVRSETILDALGADALRYFLLREIVFGSDGSFSFDALVQRFNADLANGLGNLSSRTLSMITRYFEGEVPYPTTVRVGAGRQSGRGFSSRKPSATSTTQFEQFHFSRALETAWNLVSGVNKYIVEHEPWALAEKTGSGCAGAAGDGSLYLGRGAAHCHGAGSSHHSRVDGTHMAAAWVGRDCQASICAS